MSEDEGVRRSSRGGTGRNGVGLEGGGQTPAVLGEHVQYGRMRQSLVRKPGHERKMHINTPIKALSCSHRTCKESGPKFTTII